MPAEPFPSAGCSWVANLRHLEHLVDSCSAQSAMASVFKLKPQEWTDDAIWKPCSENLPPLTMLLVFRNRTQLFTLSLPCCFPFCTSLSNQILSELQIPEVMQAGSEGRWEPEQLQPSWVVPVVWQMGGKRGLILWAPSSSVLENLHLGAVKKDLLFLP